MADSKPEFWHVFFGGNFRENGKVKFSTHCDEIRTLVRPENLLEYEVGNWEQLCAFLGAPVPQEAFPCSNDSEHFVKRCRARNRAQMRNAVLRYVMYGVCLTCIASGAMSLLERVDQFRPGPDALGLIRVA